MPAYCGGAENVADEKSNLQLVQLTKNSSAFAGLCALQGRLLL
jgi:hypothetical protein